MLEYHNSHTERRGGALLPPMLGDHSLPSRNESVAEKQRLRPEEPVEQMQALMSWTKFV